MPTFQAPLQTGQSAFQSGAFGAPIPPVTPPAPPQAEQQKLTPNLNESQLKQNIDALQKGGMARDKIQEYVNNYAKSPTGGYALKSSQTAPAQDTAPAPTQNSLLGVAADIGGNLAKGIGAVGKGILNLGFGPIATAGARTGELLGYGAGKAYAGLTGDTGLSQKLDTALAQPLGQVPILGTQVPGIQSGTAGVKQVAGEALNAGLMVAPVGRIATGAKAGLQAAGVGAKTAGALATIGTGAATGYGFDQASQLQQGKTPDFKPGLLTLAGGAIPGAAEGLGVIRNLASGQGPRIINSLIKPLQKDFSYGKNPGRTIADLGIKANNMEDLVSGITQARQKVGQAIGSIGDTLEGKSQLQLKSSLEPIDSAINQAVSQRNQAAVTRLNDIKQAITHLSGLDEKTGKIVSTGTVLLDNATFKTARDLMGKIGDMTQFTGNPSDDKLVNSALKQVYGKVKELTLKAADSADPFKAIQFRQLTEQYADLTSARIAATYRDKIVQRQNLIGLNPTIAGLGTALLTAVATGGAALPAIFAGASGAAIDKALSSVAVKTRIAALLSKKTPQELEGLGKTSLGQKLLNLAPGNALVKKGGLLEKGTANTVQNAAESRGGLIAKRDTSISTTPEAVAKKAGLSDIFRIKNFLANYSDPALAVNAEDKMAPLIKQMGLSKLDPATQKRFLKEVVDEFDQIQPRHPTTGQWLPKTTPMTQSTPKSLPIERSPLLKRQSK